MFGQHGLAEKRLLHVLEISLMVRGGDADFPFSTVLIGLKRAFQKGRLVGARKPHLFLDAVGSTFGEDFDFEEELVLVRDQFDPLFNDACRSRDPFRQGVHFPTDLPFHDGFAIARFEEKNLRARLLAIRGRGLRDDRREGRFADREGLEARGFRSFDPFTHDLRPGGGGWKNRGKRKQERQDPMKKGRGGVERSSHQNL